MSQQRGSSKSLRIILHVARGCETVRTESHGLVPPRMPSHWCERLTSNSMGADHLGLCSYGLCMPATLCEQSSPVRRRGN